MTSKAARRIQSHSDKTGRNKDFKSRAVLQFCGFFVATNLNNLVLKFLHITES